MKPIYTKILVGIFIMANIILLYQNYTLKNISYNNLDINQSIKYMENVSSIDSLLVKFVNNSPNFKFRLFIFIPQESCTNCVKTMDMFVCQREKFFNSVEIFLTQKENVFEHILSKKISKKYADFCSILGHGVHGVQQPMLFLINNNNQVITSHLINPEDEIATLNFLRRVYRVIES